MTKPIPHLSKFHLFCHSFVTTFEGGKGKMRVRRYKRDIGDTGGMARTANPLQRGSRGNRLLLANGISGLEHRGLIHSICSIDCNRVKLVNYEVHPFDCESQPSTKADSQEEQQRLFGNQNTDR
ncbi:hypothetical protein [Paenibacillus sp. MBLB4367]|uniref:hypothetical protein n=1 Tax=Paenibacillus sp. MBLB4367 TaxID=3384767 RepID=UPI0039081DDE